ncbi:MAG: hypothetical protein IPK75_17755 [Acidobacteria bacterium]|nr:hypothetical protein [Acidobacteriota bacterium]
MTDPVERINELNGYGWGHARFELGATGELHELATVITVRQLPNEPIAHFIARLTANYGMQRGDTLEFISAGGKLDIAKITKLPRC